MLLAFSLLTFSCYRGARSSGVEVLVLAPHPDDEVLMAGGVIARALSTGARVEVVVLTNGDLTCARDGLVRQRETLAALAAIGLPATQVHFLGYADGHLAGLRVTPLEVERRRADGSCTAGTTTAARHVTLVDDTPRPLTADALTDDLTAVLAATKPRHVYLPHGIDTHPDHAMTYVFFRRALDRLSEAPLVHRSVVHAKGCWPARSCEAPLALETPMPELPGALEGYTADERVPVHASAKLEWLSKFESQLDQPLQADWLSSFARRDELFFTESYERKAGRWVTRDAAVEGDARSLTSRARHGSFIERCTWREDFTSVVVEPARQAN